MRIVPPLTGHLDMALSNYAKGFRNADLITDLLFPRLEVLRQTDRYFVYGKEALQLTEQTLRAPGAPAAEIRFALSTEPYYCQSRALKSTIADEDRSSYNGDLNQDAVDTLQDKILLDREYRAMVKATTAANYPSGNTIALSGSAQLDQANSDPLGLLKAARTRIALNGAVKANTLILGYDVAEALRSHAQLLQAFRGVVVAGVLNDQQLAQVLNVDRVIVGGAVTNDPDTGLNSFVWTNFALLVYIAPQVATSAGLLGAEGKVGPKTVTFGKSFTWTAAPQTVGGYGVVVARAADPTAKADIVGVDWYSDEKITGAEVGYLITNALAANN